jgi:hypothetical protein
MHPFRALQRFNYTTASLIQYARALPSLILQSIVTFCFGVLILIIAFAILYAVIGGTGIFLLFLATIAYGCMRLYHAQQAKERAAFLASYLPFLNDYRALLACYNLDDLDPTAESYKCDADVLAKTIAAMTPPDLITEVISERTNPRDLLRHIPLTPHHFAPWRLTEIQAMFPRPLDLEHATQELDRAFFTSTKSRGDTFLGEQYQTTPRLHSTRPDAFITIPDAIRFRHSYVIGKTGSGKSVLLQHLITQDLDNDKRGVIVLSPEDGMFQKLLAYIPEHRHNDLIYFDPTSTAPPIIGVNPFDFTEAAELPPLAREELLTQRAGELYTIFERALGDLGVKMTTLMQNVAYALLQTPHATILDIDRLLHPHNAELRDTITTSKATDARTRAFWTDYDGVNATYYKSAYTTVVNRLEPFFRPPLSLTFTTPSFSFANIINADRPRIIFLNVSRLRGVQAQIAGQLLIAEIQQALQRREQVPEQERIPYYFYVDEFALFATSEKAFIDLFARARKYRMACTVAHQTTSDIPASFLDVLIGNVATIAAMQLSAGDAPYFAKELQLIEANTTRQKQITEREAAKLDAETRRLYRETGHYIDLLADPFDTLRLQHKIQDYAGGSLSPTILQNLPTGKAIVKTQGFNYGTPVSVPFLPDKQADTLALIEHSKQNFGTAETTTQPSRQPAPLLATTAASAPAEDEDEQVEFEIG